MATVADIMDRDPVTVTADTSVEDLVRILKEHQVQGVPVVNDGGRCVGFVTEEDLVLADEEGDLHLPHYIELFGGIVFLESLSRFDARLRKAVAASVGDLMTQGDDLVTVGPGASAHEAGRLIAARHHNRLPVVEHGRLVGVVTRIDVLQALTSEE